LSTYLCINSRKMADTSEPASVPKGGWQVHCGVDESGDVPFSKVTHMTNQQFSDAITDWCKAKKDKEAGQGEFILFSPIVACKNPKKPGRHHSTQNYVWNSPVIVEGGPQAVPTVNNLDELADIALKTHLTGHMCLWEKYMDAETQEEKDACWIRGHEYGLKNPVFCAFRWAGEFFGFSLIWDDQKVIYKDLPEGITAKNMKLWKWSQRHRGVMMSFGGWSKTFKNVNMEGCAIMWKNRNEGFKEMHDPEELTGQTLREMVVNVMGESEEDLFG